jgi:hypothetical protein
MIGGRKLQQENNGSPISCDCGKIVAFERNGRIYVKCHRCHREIEVATRESRGQQHPESRGH